MRPEKARTIVNRVILDYRTGNTETMYEKKTMLAINKLLAKHVIWLYEHGYPVGDYKPNLKTEYDERYIKNEMHYISDRFDHPGRLQWLATGIEEKLF